MALLHQENSVFNPPENEKFRVLRVQISKMRKIIFEFFCELLSCVSTTGFLSVLFMFFRSKEIIDCEVSDFHDFRDPSSQKLRFLEVHKSGKNRNMKKMKNFFLVQQA